MLFRSNGARGLADLVARRRLTIFSASAAIFRALVDASGPGIVFPEVRSVRLASEAITGDDVRAARRLFPAARAVVHGLATTETAVIAWARWLPDDRVPDGVLPVGRIAPHREVLIVDDDGRPVPRGETGEIVVINRCVANGYWRDPDLTARRFGTALFFRPGREPSVPRGLRSAWYSPRPSGINFWTPATCVYYWLKTTRRSLMASPARCATPDMPSTTCRQASWPCGVPPKNIST